MQADGVVLDMSRLREKEAFPTPESPEQGFAAHARLQHMSLSYDSSFFTRKRQMTRSFLDSVPGDTAWRDTSSRSGLDATGLTRQVRERLLHLTGMSPPIKADEGKAFVMTYPERLMVVVEAFGPGEMNHVTLAGATDIVERALHLVPGKEDRREEPKVRWQIMTDQGRKTVQLDLRNTNPPPDGFYPWFEGGVDAYIDEYLAAPEMVLLLRGEPGTGKTSFIRHLLRRSGLDAVVTHEPAIYGSDAYLIEHLVGDEARIMVIEDADGLILSRRDHANPVMAKFLNVADGLVDTRGRKLVISANLVEDRDIDAALMRPGRCFDAPVFRSLSPSEAAAAARAANLDIPIPAGGATLAEIFAGGRAPRKARTDAVVRKVGFR